MKRGTPEHPKFRALKSELDRDVPTVVGLLELLWHFTANYAPRGDIGKWSHLQIANGSGWAGDPDEFVEALLRNGWLDRHPEHGLVVHDWSDHADGAVRKKLQRAREDFVTPCPDEGETVSGHRPDSGGTSDDLPTPTPTPTPTPEPDAEPSGSHDPSPPAPTCDGDRTEVPEELRELPLYAADPALCGRWPELYPEWCRTFELDVMAEIRKAHAWELEREPGERRKRRTQFLGNWLRRAAKDSPSNGVEEKDHVRFLN